MARKRLFDSSVRDPRPIVKSLLDDTAPVLARTSNFFSGAVMHPTSSWRFDPPRSGIRSTQQLHVDYSKFENHIFFNSAQAKVNMAFDEMINRFPFDGSKKDLQIFLDGLGGFERYIANNFPTYIGSLAFDGAQYINVWDRAGSFFPSISGDAKGTVVLDPEKSSFSFDFRIFVPKNDTSTNAMPVCQKINDDETVGLTVGLLESKKFNDDHDGESTAPIGLPIVQSGFSYEVASIGNTPDAKWQALGGINGVLGTEFTAVRNGASSDGNGTVKRLHAPSGSIYLLISDGIGSISGSMLVEKGKFEHVAINVLRAEDDAKVEMYRNGLLVSTSSNRNLGSITSDGGSFFIGYGTKHKADIVGGVPSEIDFSSQTFVGSLDEFRFYHKSRTKDDINKNANANISKEAFLRLYYRFNEPTGSYANNNVVLDSSGHSLHSKIEGYLESCRGERGSALPEEDVRMSPVLFPSHPELVEHNKKLLFSASLYDAANPNLITRLIPHHYLIDAQIFQGLESEDGGIGDPYGTSSHIPKTGKMTQPQIISGLLFVWASFFDEIKLFVQSLGDSDYVSLVKSGSIPDQFLIDKAERMGFPLPDMYSNASLAQFLFGVSTQKDPGIIDKSLNDVQNEVWRRVLSDLNEIMNSKGTRHSIEVFLRDVGIEPNGLFRLREYGGSRKIYLGRERVKRKEVTPFISFEGAYNVVPKEYDALDNMSTNYPVLRSPFLVASRSEPGSPDLSSFHNLGEYYIGRGSQYRKAGNLVSHFRYSSGSAGKVKQTDHNVGLTFNDVTDLVTVNTGSAYNENLDRGAFTGHGYITGTISPAYALEFAGLNGTTTFSTINDAATLSFTDAAFSIALWVQFPSGHPCSDGSGGVDGTLRTLFEKQDEYELTFNAAGHLEFIAIDDAAGHNIKVVGQTPVSHNLFDGKWHMITCVYLGNEAANSLKIYVDSGLLSEGITETGTYDAMSNETTNLTICKHSTNVGAPGNYGDFAVWSAALDSIDVAGVYYSYTREENKRATGPDLPSGMLTSGSWTYEGWYKFKSHYINNLPKPMPTNQSLVRFMVTGSSAPSSTGGLIGNLVLTSGSDDGGSKLTLFMKPNLEGSTFSMVLTGANYFNGQPWHISVGRSRNDMTGSQKYSSYYLRAGTVSDGKLSYYISNTGGYQDQIDYSSRQGQYSSMFTSGSDEYNRDGVFFVIGEHQVTNVAAGAKFLHATDVQSAGSVTVADGSAASGMVERQHVTITSTYNKTIRYVLVDDYTTTMQTGDLIRPGDDYGSGIFMSNAPEVLTKSVAVAINLTGDSLSTQNDFLVQLKAAIRSVNGHNWAGAGKDVTAGNFVVGTSYVIKLVENTDFTQVGASANTVGIEFIASGVGAGTGKATPQDNSVITLGLIPAEAGGEQTMTLTQTVGGSGGDSTIESTVSNLTKVDFTGGSGLGDIVRTTDFRGQLGPIRFFSKEITEAETRQHIMNFRSIGVENPHINFNFNNNRTGSFERLRLDAHIDQDITKTTGVGTFPLFDFSNNLNHLHMQGLEEDVSPFEYFTMDYSILSPYIDRSVTSTKIRVRSFKGRSNVKKYHYAQFAPVYDVNPYEENLDDNRFSVEVSAVQGINEDIMNILGTMDSIEDAIARPNLAFASEYHDMTSLRETYFKRLTGKVRFKEFFEFFKWFDRSIGKFIDYLLPSKTNFLGTNFIVESHFLERHKVMYNFKDMYLGEEDRDGLKGEIRLQLITGSLKRL